MNQSIFQITLVVNEYDEAIAFYTGKLGFHLLEDTYIAEQDKRWVVVTPQGEQTCKLLLAKASDEEQSRSVGNQTGGRVSFFLHTDDFWRDYDNWSKNGVKFLEQPRREAYGTVAVFSDLYGNRWDLLQAAG